MRIIYDRKRKQLKHMDERGVEPHKLVSTQTFVRKLSDKLKIAIQVVDSISSTITKLRDEELWLQINELIHGYGFLTIFCLHWYCYFFVQFELSDKTCCILA